MPTPNVRIRVGASVDSSVATSFTQVIKAATQAANTIKQQFAAASAAATKSAQAAAAGSAGPYKQAGAAATQAAAATKAAAASTSAALGATATGAAAKFKALAAQLKSLPVDMQTVTREAQRALQAIAREQARAALGIGGGSGGNSRYWYMNGGKWNIRKPTLGTLSSDPVHGVARFGMGAASYAKRTAIGLASSIGVNTDLGSAMTKNVNEEDIAQKISNSGYFPGTSGPNGQIVSRGTLLNETRQTAIATGTERGELLEGLQDFVGKTGDLQTARDILGDMAKLSKATGANFSDMVNAGAEVSNVLGDVDDKGEVIKHVMMAVAGQGKLGAVEIRDLASQMAKLAGQAGKFEGGVAKNIAILGMLAQEAKIGGGAMNATQATTSVARFVQTLGQAKTIRNLRKHGLTPFTDTSETEFRDPREIIKEMLSYSGGNIEKISGLMPGSIGAKPIEGLARIYRQAHHGKTDKEADASGIAAVNAEFERMQAAMLTQEEVNRAFAEAMTDSKSKVTVFNEKLADIAGKIEESLLPALEQLGPSVLSLVQTIADAAASPAFKALVGGAEELGSHVGHILDYVGRKLGFDADTQPETFEESQKKIKERAESDTIASAIRKSYGLAQQGYGAEGLPPVMTATGFVIPQGTIDKDQLSMADKAAAKREADLEAEKQKLERLTQKFGNDAKRQPLLDRNGDQALINGELQWSAPKNKEEADILNKLQADIVNQMPVVKSQLDVLRDIHAALTDGKLTFTPKGKTGVPLPPGGTMPAAAPHL